MIRHLRWHASRAQWVGVFDSSSKVCRQSRRVDNRLPSFVSPAYAPCLCVKKLVRDRSDTSGVAYLSRLKIVTGASDSDLRAPKTVSMTFHIIWSGNLRPRQWIKILKVTRDNENTFDRLVRYRKRHCFIDTTRVCILDGLPRTESRQSLSEECDNDLFTYFQRTVCKTLLVVMKSDESEVFIEVLRIGRNN